MDKLVCPCSFGKSIDDGVSTKTTKSAIAIGKSNAIHKSHLFENLLTIGEKMSLTTLTALKNHDGRLDASGYGQADMTACVSHLKRKQARRIHH